MLNVYQKHGYNNRRHYLECIADDYGLDSQIVFSIADMLGPNEDFDGLISVLEDADMFFKE